MFSIYYIGIIFYRKLVLLKIYGFLAPRRVNNLIKLNVKFVCQVFTLSLETNLCPRYVNLHMYEKHNGKYEY